MTIPLDDYSTQAARAAEKQRRKIRKELEAQFARAIEDINAEKIAAIRGISDAEWEKAQRADAEGEA